MTRNSERGQSMVLTVIFMVVLLGFAALVVDVGGWYRTHRQMQSTADAAALAGAAKLVDGTGSASATALDFGNRNGGGVAAADISFPATYSPGDTIDVTARKPEAGVFAKLFGLMSVDVRGHARASLDAAFTGQVGRTDRSRHHASAAPVRAAALLQPTDHTRPEEDRPRRLPAPQHRRIARRHERRDTR